MDDWLTFSHPSAMNATRVALRHCVTLATRPAMGDGHALRLDGSSKAKLCARTTMFSLRLSDSYTRYIQYNIHRASR